MKQIKQEITDTCDLAIKDWLMTMRGARLAGSKARVVRVGPSCLQIFVKSLRHPEMHEVLQLEIKQKF